MTEYIAIVVGFFVGYLTGVMCYSFARTSSNYDDAESGDKDDN